MLLTEEFSNYLHLRNFGFEIYFSSSNVIAYFDKQFHCSVQYWFFGRDGQDAELVGNELFYVTVAEKQKHLVKHSLSNLMKGACDEGEILYSDIRLFTWFAQAADLFIQYANGSIALGSNVVDVPSLSNLLLDCSLVLKDGVLVTSFNATSKTNYFVLLDTNLQVLDEFTLQASAYSEGSSLSPSQKHHFLSPNHFER